MFYLFQARAVINSVSSHGPILILQNETQLSNILYSQYVYNKYDTCDIIDHVYYSHNVYIYY